MHSNLALLTPFLPFNTLVQSLWQSLVSYVVNIWQAFDKLLAKYQTAFLKSLGTFPGNVSNLVVHRKYTYVNHKCVVGLPC